MPRLNKPVRIPYRKSNSRVIKYFELPEVLTLEDLLSYSCELRCAIVKHWQFTSKILPKRNVTLHNLTEGNKRKVK